MPVGWHGASANFSIFGDAVSCSHAEFGMGRPDWFLSIQLPPALYVGYGLLFDVRDYDRQRGNSLMWATVATGLLGPVAINKNKLEEEGQCAPCWVLTSMRPHIGFPCRQPRSPAIGPFLIDWAGGGNYGPHALEAAPRPRPPPPQIRGRIEDFRASKALRRYVTGPIDLFLLYTDERAIWTSCPALKLGEIFGIARRSFSTLSSQNRNGAIVLVVV